MISTIIQSITPLPTIFLFRVVSHVYETGSYSYPIINSCLLIMLAFGPSWTFQIKLATHYPGVAPS